MEVTYYKVCDRWNQLKEAHEEDKGVAKIIEETKGEKTEITDINKIKIK